jgi:hypothetical protein
MPPSECPARTYGRGTCARRAGVQIAGRVGAPGGGGVAAPVTGAVVGADPSWCGRRPGRFSAPSPGRVRQVPVRVRRSGCASRCRDAQSMPADVDDSGARVLREGRVGRVAQRLVATADGSERQDAEHWVQQPRLHAAGGPALGVHDDPTTSASSSGAPETSERGQRRRPARRRRARRRRRPSAAAGDRRAALRSIGEARRQPGQERPAGSEAEQERAVITGLAVAANGSGAGRHPSRLRLRGCRWVRGR